MYVWYRMMISYVRRITLACNTAALVPRAVCSSLRSPVQQWKNMRTVSSRRENKNVPPVPSKKKVPSLPVVEEILYRPVPSWKIICTVPSRRAKSIYGPVPSWQHLFTVLSHRDNFYLPCRPVVTIFTYRPVPSWQFLLTVPSRRGNFYLPSRSVMKQKGHCTVPSRPVEKIHTHGPVLSHSGNYISIILPSRPVVFNFFPAKHIKTVPSRPVSNITSHEKPWKIPRTFAHRVPIFNTLVF